MTGLGPDGVLPVIGTKELVASLPMHLGLGAGDTVVVPELAYPTYAVGAALVGARTVATDSLTSLGPERPALLWLNSPSNPTGRVLPVAHLRKVVDWCRERGTLLVSDECYLECAWEADPVSVLHPDVCGDSHDGILAVHSLSKRSNLAGYRCGFVAGDPAVVAELLAVRKNLGLIEPGPQQVAMAAALADDTHVAEQHARYRARRTTLRAALEGAGFRVDHSEASLYLWSTRDEDCWTTVADLADLGILVAPGTFYGRAGRGTCGWHSPRPTNVWLPLPLDSEPARAAKASAQNVPAPGIANAPSSPRAAIASSCCWSNDSPTGASAMVSGMRTAEIDSRRTTACSECVLRMTP